jgi:excisionase family DNA binding protein
VTPTYPIYESGRGRAVAMTKEFLDIHDLSVCLSIKRSTLYAMVENGELPHYKVGRLIRFRKSDVDKWMESHRSGNIDVGQRAKRILKTSRPRVDINALVKKTIEDVKDSGYNLPHGKPNRIKGLRKEVEDGTL